MSSSELLPRFDRLYAISDLHIGGAEGARVFQGEDQFKVLIDDLIGKAKGEERNRVALVLNGDTVDFLAIDKPEPLLTPERACEALEEMAETSAERVFSALSKFLSTERCTLVLTLGNHDVELALPPVRRKLTELLCVDDAARGRLHLALDDIGFSCVVGDTRVLCVHGNEVDSWNIVDHENLHEVATAYERGEGAPPWQGNAGTRLVLDVMNDLKKDYPFVELLKPETKLVPRVLLATDPAVATKLKDALPTLKRLIVGWGKRRGLLGEPLDDGSDAFDGAFHPPPRKRSDRREFLDNIEALVENDVSASEFVGEADGETLGIWRYLWSTSEGEDKDVALARELNEWGKAYNVFAFDPDEGNHATDESADEPCWRLERRVGDNIDILVAGHTHLSRTMPRRESPIRFYFNSGTWAFLIELPDTGDVSAEYAKALLDSDLETLVKNKIVTRRYHVVEIALTDDQQAVEGRLVEPRDGTLEPVSGAKTYHKPISGGGKA